MTRVGGQDGVEHGAWVAPIQTRTPALVCLEHKQPSVREARDIENSCRRHVCVGKASQDRFDVAPRLRVKRRTVGVQQGTPGLVLNPIWRRGQNGTALAEDPVLRINVQPSRRRQKLHPIREAGGVDDGVEFAHAR